MTKLISQKFQLRRDLLLVQSITTSVILPSIGIQLSLCLIYECRVTGVCRRVIESFFDEQCYQAMNVLYQGDGERNDRRADDDRSNSSSHDNIRAPLVQILVQLLQCRNDDLQMTTARLLFDMHKRESLLFAIASESYICTDPSFPVFEELVKLGSLLDDDKLLAKMHTGNLGDLRQTLLDKLDQISAWCLLEDDPAEPHTSHQRITYSTRELLAFIMCFVCMCV